MSSRGALTTLRRRALGVALLMCMVLFVGLTVAIYNRAFESTVDILLRTPSTGNQLKTESDVKVRGVNVGRVEDVSATGDGAELKLALQPDKARMLPANVSARLLPKTLFGERYVSLDAPQQPTPATLSSGDVIEQDRSHASMELETVLSDTLPVLQAVHPEELASTLNALDQALAGRGEPLGETLSQLNSYVDRLNPSVPDLRENLHQLVGVAETYEQAAPDVLQAMRNLTTTSRTLVDQRTNLQRLTSEVTGTSEDTEKFLRENRQNLIRLNKTGRPTLDILGKYAPAYPCFLNEMAQYVPRARQLFGEGTGEPGLHVTLEVSASRGKYVPNQDEPEFKDKRGPRCYNGVQAPEPFPEYPPDGPFQDGSVPPPASDSGREVQKHPDVGKVPPGNTGSTSPQSTSPQSTVPQSTSPQSGGFGAGAPSAGPLSAGPPSAGPPSAGPGAGTFRPVAGDVQNSPAERDLVSAVMAPSLGVARDDVPQWGSLLVGPVLRGAEVSYR